MTACVLVLLLVLGAFVAVPSLRASWARDAAVESHQRLAQAAYLGLEQAANAWLALPVRDRSDLLLTGGARVGTEDGSADLPTVTTEVVRTEADLVVLRLTVVSDGHRSVVYEKRSGNASDTCSTSDLAQVDPGVDCEAWALTPLPA